MRRRWIPVFLAGALASVLPATPVPAAGDGDPATPAEAMDLARPLVDTARRMGPESPKDGANSASTSTTGGSST